MKALFICLLFIIASPANSQPLLLYKADDLQGKYVLSFSRQEGDKSNVYKVVIAETFSVQVNGEVCHVTMSNACVFWTTISDVSSLHSTNKFVQNKAFIGTLKMDFLKGTKLIFNNSVMELSQARLGKTSETNMLHYEGEAALQELKKMGLKPPVDFDEKKKK